MDHLSFTLLIVDDEASIRNGLCNAIDWQSLGISIIGTASNGKEAYSFIQKYAPDFVITDLKMPLWDGLRLIEETSYLDIDTRFIILSGYGDFNYAKLAMKYGVKSYLLKPIKKEELLSEISTLKKEVLEKRKQHSTQLEVKRNLKKSTHALKDQFFAGLLQNEYTQETKVLSLLDSYQIHIKNEPLQTLLFTYELPLSDTTHGFSKKDYLLFEATLTNVLEELLLSTPHAIFKYQKKHLVVVLNTPLLDISAKQVSCWDFCKSVTEIFQTFSHIPLYVGIGDEVPSLLLVGSSYRSALEALSYKLYKTNCPIFDSSVICKESPTLSANNLDVTSLVDALCIGDSSFLKDYLENFFSSLFYTELPPPSFLKGMCLYLIIDVQKKLSKYLEKDEKYFEEVSYNLIDSFSSLEDLKIWIEALLFQYIELIHDQKPFNRDPVIEKAKKYIQQNIFKKLKADEVAAHVNLSESYFSVYFKEKTNQNFKNYLLQLKVEHAKELLKEGHKSIGEIAFLLGYEDYRAFNRIFKKATGKNPTEFQQQFFH
jgi:two-component system response regulator YesN